ncbi:uncharacterized, partial [Tachysurus ichikawai]
ESGSRADIRDIRDIRDARSVRIMRKTWSRAFNIFILLVLLTSMLVWFVESSLVPGNNFRVMPCRASRPVDVMFFVDVQVEESGFSSRVAALMTSATQNNVNEGEQIRPLLSSPRHDEMPCHDR